MYHWYLACATPEQHYQPVSGRSHLLLEQLLRGKVGAPVPVPVPVPVPTPAPAAPDASATAAPAHAHAHAHAPTAPASSRRPVCPPVPMAEDLEL
jgi:hypothetical protein